MLDSLSEVYIDAKQLTNEDLLIPGRITGIATILPGLVCYIVTLTTNDLTTKWKHDNHIFYDSIVVPQTYLQLVM